MAPRQDRARAWPARAQRRRGADPRLRSRQIRPGRYIAGGRRARLHRPVARTRRGRSHRACRFRGAGAVRGKHRRPHSWPHSAARPAAAARHRATRCHAQGQRRARQGAGDRARGVAPDRNWRAGHGRVIQGARHRRSKTGAATRIRDAAMMIEARTLALDGIRHGFFTRQGGVSGGLYVSLNGGVGSNDAGAHVAENRARMAAAVGVEPSRFLTCYQIHSPQVVVAETPWLPEARPRADAIVTRMRALAIGISTADCGPVLLADPSARGIGAAHAGWRGALSGVVEAAVDAMERLGAERSQIRAAIGPMIRQPNYEVGPDLMARLDAQDPASHRFFAPAARDGHAMFDLPGYIDARLTRAGLRHVEDVGLCTYADAERFFSFRRTTHRAEADYGRHVNAIALVG